MIGAGSHRDGGGNADQHQKWRQQKTAADTKQARKPAHAKADAKQQQGIYTHFSDRQVDLHRDSNQSNVSLTRSFNLVVQPRKDFLGALQGRNAASASTPRGKGDQSQKNQAQKRKARYGEGWADPIRQRA